MQHGKPKNMLLTTSSSIGLIAPRTLYTKNKGPRRSLYLITIRHDNHYLFITYIVTSKPKRISVAAGVVHMMLILIYDKQNCLLRKLCVFCNTKYTNKNSKIPNDYMDEVYTSVTPLKNRVCPIRST